MGITNIPAPRVEFIDKRTGLMAREWYLFFLNLFNLTGGGSNNLSLLDVQQGPPPYPEPAPNNSYLIQPSGITVGASPFTFTNDNLYTVDIIVEGGGVSLLEFSRDGTTWYSTGSFYGMFTLSKGDRLRATYAAAPNMTLIPR